MTQTSTSHVPSSSLGATFPLRVPMVHLLLIHLVDIALVLNLAARILDTNPPE